MQRAHRENGEDEREDQRPTHQPPYRTLARVDELGILAALASLATPR
jgi:hypothetical protein